MKTYEIRRGKYAPFALYSLVKNPKDTFHGPDYVHENFVCDGTYEHCLNVRYKLEAQKWK